jgi:hypothetical protein
LKSLLQCGVANIARSAVLAIAKAGGFKRLQQRSAQAALHICISIQAHVLFTELLLYAE